MLYHVRVTPIVPTHTYAFNKDAHWIEEHIATPLRQGRDIFIGGNDFSWADIDKIRIRAMIRTCGWPSAG